MPLSVTQKNDVLVALQEAGLDPREFLWADGSTSLEGGVATLFRHWEQPPSGRFEFAYYDRNWWYRFEPGDSAPYGSGNAGSWGAEMTAVETWALSLRSEIDAPDLWAELARERELLSQPNADETSNTPFTTEELAVISRQIEELKRYVVESQELTAEQQRLLTARLDHVERAAPHTGRIDWWNQLVGALINLVLTNVLPPAAVQGLLVLAAHGLAGLFGGTPPELLAN